MNADPTFPDFTPLPSAPERPTYGYRPRALNAPPAVSIVTPFYETGEIFRQTAESVFRQTMQQWEWIIVNDASADSEALETLAEYRDIDPRIRVIDHAVNRGVGAARNSGFEAARTDYVVQLDSDDLLEPTMVEKLYWCLQSYPAYSFAKGYTAGFGVESYLWINGFHFREAFLETNHADALAMIKRSAARAVGGYDEANPDGLEDWDFWLNCASHGYWGGTVHEPLSWVRRRPDHGVRWPNWDGGPREAAFRSAMRDRYPDLWRGGFPEPASEQTTPNQPLPDALPASNQLVKDGPRILLILPRMSGEATGRVHLDAVEELTGLGWQVTLATTAGGNHQGEREYGRFTPDVFVLHRFLRSVDYPRFLRYLIESRSPDVVLVSDSELGYRLLPYFRAHHPHQVYVDLTQDPSGDLSNQYRDQLDLSMVTSDDLLSTVTDDVTRVAVLALGKSAGPRLDEVMEMARQLHASEPRAAVSVASANASAAWAVEEHHRAGREQPSDASTMSEPAAHRHPAGSGEPAIGERLYAGLMRALGAPYRRLKARFPDAMLAGRDRIRSWLGYRRG